MLRPVRSLPLALALSIGWGSTLHAETVNWPLETPPAGVNPAAYPVPRNDWMVRFTDNLKQAQGGNIDLLFQGDSITHGWKSLGAAVWKERYENRNVASFGISSDRTQNVLWRMQHGELDGISPKLLVLMIGTNNLGDSAPQIAEGITAIVREVQKRCPRTHILLLGIFPRGASPTDGQRVKIAEINKLIEPLGREPSVTYLDIGEKFLAPDGTLSKEIMPDLLHPSLAGYRIWADAIQPVVDQYCR